MSLAVDMTPQLREQLSVLVGSGERWGWIFKPPPEPGLSWRRSAPPQDTNAPDYAQKYQQWQQDVLADEAGQKQRFESDPVFWPMGRLGKESIVDVFGGSAVGWKKLLVTVASSLLGQGHHVTIANLSERATSDPMIELARICDFPVRVDEIAPSGSTVDLLHGLPSDQLISFLLRVIHDDDHDSNITEDRAVLRRISRALDEPITVQRLQAGLGAALLERSPSAALSPEEVDSLTTLYGGEVREHSGIVERLMRLEDQLDELSVLCEVAQGSAGSGETQEVLPGLPPPPKVHALHVLRIGQGLELRDYDLAVAMVLESIVRQVRLGGSSIGDEILFVVGADGIKQRAMDSIVTAVAEHGLRLVLLFEHLREDNVSTLGGESTKTVFMRLGNHKEAATAADFIGKSYRFTLSEVTTTSGRSTETSTAFTEGSERGSNTSTTRGAMFFQSSVSAGQSQSQSQSTTKTEMTGTTSSLAESIQRVHEFVVEPEQLQALPETALIMTHPGGEQPAIFDCDPNIITMPRVYLGPVAQPS